MSTRYIALNLQYSNADSILIYVPPMTAPLYVLSDATGNSAEQMVRAALFQFRGTLPSIRVWPRVRSTEDIDTIVESAAQSGAMIIHTLVTPEHADALNLKARLAKVECVDLIGPLLSKLSIFMQQTPRGRPGRHPKLNAAYFRRMEAVEFTVNADDGRGLDRLNEADIVLVGTSRTSKTPVAAYLAGHGYKVANVPLIKNVEPPKLLGDLARGTVFALTVDPDKLAEIRSARLTQLGVDMPGEYADFDHVVEELRWADDLFRKHGWPVINVSRLAVEETAARILQIHQRYHGPQHDADD